MRFKECPVAEAKDLQYQWKLPPKDRISPAGWPGDQSAAHVTVNVEGGAILSFLSQPLGQHFIPHKAGLPS
jgi:hypothetical protein